MSAQMPNTTIRPIIPTIHPCVIVIFLSSCFYFISSPSGRADGHACMDRWPDIRRQTGMSRKPLAKQGARVRIPVRVSGARSAKKPAAYIQCGTVCSMYVYSSSSLGSSDFLKSFPIKWPATVIIATQITVSNIIRATIALPPFYYSAFCSAPESLKYPGFVPGRTSVRTIPSTSEIIVQRYTWWKLLIPSIV